MHDTTYNIYIRIRLNFFKDWKAENMTTARSRFFSHPSLLVMMLFLLVMMLSLALAVAGEEVASVVISGEIISCRG